MTKYSNQHYKNHFSADDKTKTFAEKNFANGLGLIVKDILGGWKDDSGLCDGWEVEIS